MTTSSTFDNINIPIDTHGQTTTETASWVAFESNATLDLADAFPLASIVSRSYPLGSRFPPERNYPLHPQVSAWVYLGLPLLRSFHLDGLLTPHSSFGGCRTTIIHYFTSSRSWGPRQVQLATKFQPTEITSQVAALELSFLDAAKERDERTTQMEDLGLPLQDVEKDGRAGREQHSQAVKQNAALSESELKKTSKIGELQLRPGDIEERRDDKTSQLAKLRLLLQNIEKQRDESHQDLTRALEKVLAFGLHHWNAALSRSQIDQTSELQGLQLHLQDIDASRPELTRALEKNTVLSQSQLDTTSQLQGLHLRIQDVEKERDASRDELTEALERTLLSPPSPPKGI